MYVKVKAWRDKSVSRENQKNDGEFSIENIDLESTIKGRKENIEIRVWT